MLALKARGVSLAIVLTCPVVEFTKSLRKQLRTLSRVNLTFPTLQLPQLALLWEVQVRKYKTLQTEKHPFREVSIDPERNLQEHSLQSAGDLVHLNLLWLTYTLAAQPTRQ